MKTYTIGEIFRLGLLKGADGKPYLHKASVTNALARSGAQKVMTKWGMGYAVTMKEINAWNRHWS